MHNAIALLLVLGWSQSLPVASLRGIAGASVGVTNGACGRLTRLAQADDEPEVPGEGDDLDALGPDIEGGIGPDIKGDVGEDVEGGIGPDLKGAIGADLTPEAGTEDEVDDDEVGD
jgi:hypothetical protein